MYDVTRLKPQFLRSNWYAKSLQSWSSWFYEKNWENWKLHKKIVKIQQNLRNLAVNNFDFTRKWEKFKTAKIREKAKVLCCLAVSNNDFTRKIEKILKLLYFFSFWIFVEIQKKISWFRPFTKIISKLKNYVKCQQYKLSKHTFFSELKSPGQVIVLSFSSRNLAMYSKSGVNFPLDVMTAPDTTDPTLLISCSSKGWKNRS